LTFSTSLRPVCAIGAVSVDLACLVLFAAAAMAAAPVLFRRTL